MKIIFKIFLYAGIGLMVLALVMFIYGAYMFSYRGEFSTLEKDLGELSFMFWLPTLLAGIFSTAVGISLRNYERKKSKALRASERQVLR